MKGKAKRLVLCVCASLMLWGINANATENENTVNLDVTDIDTVDTDSVERDTVETDSVERDTVIVGYYQQDGYFEKQADGKLYGYGVEYLNTIATYTNWKYEFLEGTREECVEWLEQGVIDLLSPVYTDTVLENVILANRIIGEDNCYIYKSSNNFEINQEDYTTFRECIVGVVKESGLEEKILEHCINNKFVFDSIVPFASLEDAQRELADGKIDLLATDSYVNVDNMKVVSSFVSGMITFASSDEAIIDELNKAMEKIKLHNPSYDEELKEKYFYQGSQKNVEYSSEEIAFLDQDLNYRVALSNEQYPISFLNEEGEYCGIAADILDVIHYYTGIEFELVYVDSYSKGKELLDNAEVDILAGSVLDKPDVDILNNINDGEYIADFLDYNVAFIGKKGTDVSDNLTVAVSSYLEDGLLYLEKEYPNYRFVIYQGDDECFDAIVNGEVDMAVQTDMKINELNVYDKYKDIRKLKNIPANFRVAYTIHTDNKVLVSILKKTLTSLSEATISNIESSNMEYIEDRGMTIEEFLENYLVDIVFIMIFLSALLTGLIMFSKYKKEQKSKEKAYTDSLTGLSSMEKFRLDVEEILRSDKKEDYYLIALDIDKFKVINDLYGYEEGDKTIAYVGRVCKEGLSSNDCITRVNADNFMILKKTRDIHDVYAYLNRIFEIVSDEIETRDTHFRLILKAGICKVREEDKILSHILDKASLAKKNMKKSHVSTYKVYSESMRQKNIEDKLLENDMEEALKTRQFQIYLQPQIDLMTKKIVSAEALVRWIHPTKGLIPPFQFIPVFESNGFITRLDLYVWEEAIKTIAEWKKQSKITVPIAINLSRADIERDGMIEALCDLMKKYNLDSEWIKTELTESIYLENEKVILEKMNKLKKFGFKIAVDDFGSGYSSLHLLKSMPVDILKIDKSFLGMSSEMRYQEEIILRNVIGMGKDLGLQMIMEGVETAEQSEFLEAIGCDIVQGYYYGKPMPVEDFEEELINNYEGGNVV